MRRPSALEVPPLLQSLLPCRSPCSHRTRLAPTDSFTAPRPSVTRSPADATAYAELGAAYFQRARETGDVSDYQLAEQSLTKSLDLVSVDFSADVALGTMASVCMGEHRFTDALSYAQKALSLGTGDVSSFAIVGDAYADMGEYDKAGVAYGRLTPRDMTLSPRAAYARDSRLSYLKFIAGDTPAAIALMKTAVTEGVEAQLQSENLAWLYYELGEYYTQAGDASSADAAYLAALNTHPGDYRALAALGKLRANNGRYAEAIVLYQKAIAVVPMPIFVAELGDIYARSGNQAEAKKQYALVEYIGLLGHINQVLHNRDLALFYADHDMKLAESLDLAQKELEVRHDVYTWDALAWALYKNGKLTEAAKASEKATQFGTQDPLLLFHAGMIADRLGQPDQARAALKEALQINPRFHLIYANEAQQRARRAGSARRFTGRLGKQCSLKGFAGLLTLLFLLGLCRLALAHPMGNFSVNHYSRIDLQSDRVIVRYFIDLAEIPTYQELQQGNIAATLMDPNSPEVIHFVAARGAELEHGLVLDIDGKQMPLRMVSSGVIFPPGAGGLPTMKMGFVYEAAYPSTVDRGHVNLRYADNNYPGHTGWKEIIALAPAGSMLQSSVPATDRSGELSNYPTDLLTSPPQNLEASVVAALPVLPAAAADAQSHVASEQPSQRAQTPAAGAAPAVNYVKEKSRYAPNQTGAVAVAALVARRRSLHRRLRLRCISRPIGNRRRGADLPN